ncbi:MAG: hypothetical protein ACO23H_15880 [Alphaproteobacteria bacterium]
MKDEYSGQGGSYLIDPETGKRTLIKRTLPADPPQENGTTSSTETTDSDRNRVNLRSRSDSNRNRRGFGEGLEHHSTAE